MNLLTQAVNQLQSKLPTREVMLVPGDLFFVLTLDLPADVSGDEAREFAELSIEGNSPFTLDQVSWGCLRREGEPRILVYAVYNERLRRDGYGDMDSPWHVFPAFLPVLGSRADRTGWRFVGFGHSISALYMERGGSIPTKVVSRTIKAEAEAAEVAEAVTPEKWLAERNRLAAELVAQGGEAESGIHLACVPVVDDSDNVRFSERYITGDGASGVAETALEGLSGEQRWSADIRPASFIVREKKDRDSARRIWWATLGAAAAVVVLLLGQLGLYIGNVMVDKRRDLISSRTGAVHRIAENKDLLDKINQFTRNELDPFAMLEELNEYRPPAFHFTRVFADAYNELRVQGQGSASVKVFNAFVDSLRDSGSVERVGVKNSVRNGVVKFELEITFADAGPVAAEAVAARAR